MCWNKAERKKDGGCPTDTRLHRSRLEAEDRHPHPHQVTHRLAGAWPILKIISRLLWLLRPNVDMEFVTCRSKATERSQL